LLGRSGNLPWKYKNDTLTIELKSVKYNEMPSHHAWTLKIENYE
jgi:hypothetical protein